MEPYTIFGGFAGVGVLAAGFGFAYAQFRSGASKGKDDYIEVLKGTADAERKKASLLAEENANITKNHQAQLNILTEKVGKLQGLYEAADRLNKEYLAILQGRDPKMEKFMEQTVETLTNINSNLQNLNDTLKNAPRESVTTTNIRKKTKIINKSEEVS